MIRTFRVWLVLALLIALAIFCAGWKWTGPHKSPGTQLAGWSWDGAKASTQA
jgi:hypothetical protein